MTTPSTPAARLRRDARAAECSQTVFLTDRLMKEWADDHGRVRHTLLAVCPNSETVTRSALQAANEARAPLLYAATLNQVDRNGGYTDWTPATFSAFVSKEVDRLGVDVPVILCLDHGGPWKKDAHVRDGLDYETSLAEVKTSIRACIDAGYDLLHLDPTVDLRLPPGQPVAIETIVERTVELLQDAEAHRNETERGPIAYEVGTEESGGGLQSEDRFCDFLRLLGAELDRKNLPRPRFVVGDVGTRLDTSHVNGVRIERLTTEARRQIGALLKGHYTDSVHDLTVYPLSGVGGANVGPGLSAAEFDAIKDLVKLEQRLDIDSGFIDAVRTAVIESGRWRKWLHPEEAGLDFMDLPKDRRDWLVHTGSRYVWTNPSVQSARRRLYDNVRDYRDPEAFVHWRVRTEILRYMHAFNLVGLTERL
ncbi:tagatose-bisphosphate aldolase [Longibacter salinarum]|uniref:Tagatose-bisphosphate aldolase n=1 Tax=Longibacter salinarum TaxID=1850348 RepID=A0A2A8CZX0_9BACT|nr:class II D-tagatose-bisphosphate aldolase, non-catalytic subunit [Longibacter salinarum]PEN14170.1 tagatose-bisphosphate aldolase [Longibacter salinarum]